MYNSFDGWYDFFSKKIKLKMDFLDVDKDSIINIFQVRNIFVHNGGIINRIFLSKVKNIKGNYNEGDRFLLTREFVMSSVFLLEKQGLLLLYHLWLKISDDESLCNDGLFLLGFNKMENNEWDISRIVFEELNKHIDSSSESYLINRVNILQCLKWSGKEEELKKEIDLQERKFSMYSNKYKIAIYAIKDEYDLIIKLLPKVGYAHNPNKNKKP